MTKVNDRNREQKCVRTYEVNHSSYYVNPCSCENCGELNSYLRDGWKVVMVIPKRKYNEYIIEKESK